MCTLDDPSLRMTIGAEPELKRSRAACPGQAGAVTPRLRADIVNWMCATAYRLDICSDGLFLGVALLDRFLACSSSSSSSKLPFQHMGLASCACLALAAKYEASQSPPLAAYMAFLSPEHSLEQLQDSEVVVLRALDYRLAHIPTLHSALTAIFTSLEAAEGAPHLPRRLACLTRYLAELVLLEQRLAALPPPHLAAACFAYALLLTRTALPAQLLAGSTGYAPQQLSSAVAWVAAIHATVCQSSQRGTPYAAALQYGGASAHGVAHLAPLRA
jgi:Cyclin, N-terminal domain/Cyclin, C-terminal domain